MDEPKTHAAPLQRTDTGAARPNAPRRLYLRAVALWVRLRNTVTLGLFGASGATAVASVQHVIHTCSGGNCAGCGRCAVALVAAAAAASGGIAARTRGARRWRLIALVIVLALFLYGVLEAWKRGWLPLPG